MDSKEKIVYLEQLYYSKRRSGNTSVKEYNTITEIIKDLEILEIFKNNRHLVIHKDDDTFILSFNVNVNEIDDFKEWLNGKD